MPECKVFLVWQGEWDPELLAIFAKRKDAESLSKEWNKRNKRSIWDEAYVEEKSILNTIKEYKH